MDSKSRDAERDAINSLFDGRKNHRTLQINGKFMGQRLPSRIRHSLVNESLWPQIPPYPTNVIPLLEVSPSGYVKIAIENDHLQWIYLL